MNQITALKLGTDNIGKLLAQYAIPAIIAMTAASLYNMVDSIFIGHGVGPLAISGLALTFPLMNLAAAFGSLVGVGASTLISVKLGQKDYDTAQHVLGHVLVLNLILGSVLMVITLIFLEPILYFFGASDQTMGYAKDYMTVIIIGNVVSHLYYGLNAVLRSAGHPQKAMGATIFTVVINSILDPLFIFVFKMGIEGAAFATVLSQLLALAWQFKLFSDKNELIHFKKGIYKLKEKMIREILSIGMSPFLMNVSSCLIIIVVNQSLKRYGGDLAIGAYGIVNRLVFVVVMIVIGLNQGMQPIAGYNFGARAYDRVSKVLKITILWGMLITTLGFVIGNFFPHWAVKAFTTDQTLIDLSVEGLKIITIFFPIVGFQIVSSNFFQSIGFAKKAIFLSLTRQLLFLLPCLLYLPTVYGLKGIWYSFPTADFVATFISATMLFHQIRTFNKEHKKSLAPTDN